MRVKTGKVPFTMGAECDNDGTIASFSLAVYHDWA